ncbi:MAG TPA: hypothetical protein VJY65_06830 [Chloroflexota bacterium]|nr:hypothetical protein [Chloroflexota bacterium]
MAETIRSAVHTIMRLLAKRDYAGVEGLTGGRSLSARDLEGAVREYGGTITLPPPAAYEELLDVVEMEGTLKRAWSVRMPVWTAEEGRSDLALDLTVTQAEGRLVVEVDGLHVP